MTEHVLAYKMSVTNEIVTNLFQSHVVVDPEFLVRFREPLYWRRLVLAKVIAKWVTTSIAVYCRNPRG